ncbi:hypothetical protein [Leucobacter chromiireducens]
MSRTPPPGLPPDHPLMQHLRQQGQSQRPKRRRFDTHDVVTGVLSMAVLCWAAWEILGIGNAFGYEGLSVDDAKAKMSEDNIAIIFDPVGFLIALGLVIASFIIHKVGGTGLTLGGLIATAALFVLSFFRVSMLVPMLFGAIGGMTSTVYSSDDLRVPTADNSIVDPGQLIMYQGGEGVRIATAFANTSDEHWESATLALEYSDASGVVCGVYEHVERFLGPGQRVEVSTEFLAAATRYADPSCVPVAASAELTSIDVDSRAEIPEADYVQQDSAAPELASLYVSEEPGIVSSVVTVSVAGAVSPEAVDSLQGTDGRARLPMAFELVDHEGQRLAWCFAPEDVQPDGGFITGKYHSPVEPGSYASVAIVPSC